MSSLFLLRSNVAQFCYFFFRIAAGMTSQTVFMDDQPGHILRLFPKAGLKQEQSKHFNRKGAGGV